MICETLGDLAGDFAEAIFGDLVGVFLTYGYFAGEFEVLGDFAGDFDCGIFGDFVRDFTIDFNGLIIGDF
jgi:hypothetical protein